MKLAFYKTEILGFGLKRYACVINENITNSEIFDQE